MRRVDVSVKLREFVNLPDDAIVSDALAAAILDISEDTLKRSSPVPWRQISSRRGGRRAGDLRALVRGEAA